MASVICDAPLDLLPCPNMQKSRQDTLALSARRRANLQNMNLEGGKNAHPWV
ncbi:hypothetical protein [Herbaspirillum camelliae]|uniref:hypothetical protein n=1 Tax=Herbaspirillum camelliae TaxID=1892903 RepID=UPI0013017201|nr:hypothetical protein [Herbaspirillum camelliae]